MITLAEPLQEGREVAAAIGVKPQTLAAWRNRGEGPRFVKVGKLIRYRTSDINKWLSTRLVEPSRRVMGGVS
jgi:predicted DNA-binding transcriptional regulator AlpA